MAPPRKPTVSAGEDGCLRDVREVFARLDAEHEPSDLGNKENPLDEMVFILLSVKTPEHRYHRAYERVRVLVGSWQNLLEVDESDLRAAIGDAGLSSAKAQVLKAVARDLQERLGEVSLRCLFDMDTAEAERFLKSLPGVGVKVAKCVVMYSLNRPVFPVDTHCFRVGSRLGWFPPSTPRTDSRLQAVEDAVPVSLRQALHVRLVQHGRAVCQPKRPHCERCSLTDLCEYFRYVRPV